MKWNAMKVFKGSFIYHDTTQGWHLRHALLQWMGIYFFCLNIKQIIYYLFIITFIL